MERLRNNRHFLGLLFMLPAAIVLIVFLTYPLFLGVWLGLTDVKVFAYRGHGCLDCSLTRKDRPGRQLEGSPPGTKPTTSHYTL